MEQKITVAVLFGGVSSEHEVSRLSVTSVLNNLDPDLYEVIVVGITKEGHWLRYTGSPGAIADGSWQNQTDALIPCILSPDCSHHGLLLLEGDSCRLLPVDVVFPVLHGKNGEDGTIQGLLEMSAIPYVGCGVMASANCMDKDTAKRLFTAAGIPNARWITARPPEMEHFNLLCDRVLQEIGFPVFVKPANAGSSVGVSKASDRQGLQNALAGAFRHDSKVIIEETLCGAEVECAVLGNGSPFASSVVGEIVPVRELYDYEGKYLDGSTDLYIPARISPEQAESVREYALRAYTALECTGLSRIDFFALRDGKSVVLNEINTMPGFTNISMYPKLMIASGFSYPQLLDRLIQLALNK